MIAFKHHSSLLISVFYGFWIYQFALYSKVFSSVESSLPILEHSPVYSLQIVHFYHSLLFSCLEPLFQPYNSSSVTDVFCHMYVFLSFSFCCVLGKFPRTICQLTNFFFFLSSHFSLDLMLSKDISKYFPRFWICSFGIFHISFFFFLSLPVFLIS